MPYTVPLGAGAVSLQLCPTERSVMGSDTPNCGVSTDRCAGVTIKIAFPLPPPRLQMPPPPPPPARRFTFRGEQLPADAAPSPPTDAAVLVGPAPVASACSARATTGPDACQLLSLQVEACQARRLPSFSTQPLQATLDGSAVTTMTMGADDLNADFRQPAPVGTESEPAVMWDAAKQAASSQEPTTLTCPVAPDPEAEQGCCTPNAVNGVCTSLQPPRCPLPEPPVAMVWPVQDTNRCHVETIMSHAPESNSDVTSVECSSPIEEEAVGPEQTVAEGQASRVMPTDLVQSGLQQVVSDMLVLDGAPEDEIIYV